MKKKKLRFRGYGPKKKRVGRSGKNFFFILLHVAIVCVHWVIVTVFTKLILTIKLELIQCFGFILLLNSR